VAIAPQYINFAGSITTMFTVPPLADSLLQKPLIDLPFSHAFKLMASANGCQNLEEILCLNLSTLLTQPGFSPDVQQELVVFLKSQGWLPRLKQF
jgi:hypothetical protein